MALNAALIAAVFILVGFIGRRPPDWLIQLGLGEEWLKAGLWLTAVILSLPMLIATSRKLQALGMLVAETRVTDSMAGERAAAIRAVVAQLVPIAGTVVMGVYVVMLSSTFLPTYKVFVVLLLLVSLMSWLLRRSFIRVYSKAQVALQETLAQRPHPVPANHGAALPPTLRDADLEMLTIDAGSSAIGSRIRETQLRALTGASIVAIERAGESIVNPGPDEEIREGDRVLLIGNRKQLEAAVGRLSVKSPSR
jgi:CPA2 family monovalent cation:H+ antiporter-2